MATLVTRRMFLRMAGFPEVLPYQCDAGPNVRKDGMNSP
jgi:hypothetical protein